MAQEIANDVVRGLDVKDTWRSAVLDSGGLDATACEVAGLAHDLGHPPFGHAGEVVLNKKLRKHGVRDGFEGNAQSFRIVTRLDRQKADAAFGLDLTRVSLAAILKYPRHCPRPQRLGGLDAQGGKVHPPKFGAYLDDRDAFLFASELFLFDQTGYRQTLEASIMDLADDITYAVHDLEDAFVENVIDFATVSKDLKDAQALVRKHQLHELKRDTSNYFVFYAVELFDKYGNYFSKDYYEKSLGRAATLIQDANFDKRFSGSPEQAAEASEALSDMIEEIMRELQVSNDPPYPGGPSVYVEQPAWHHIQVLKTVTRRYVIGTSRIGVLERAQESVLSTLYEGLTAWLESQPRVSELPQPLSQMLQDSERAYGVADRVHTPGPIEHRALGDYICSLSDRECLDQSRWFLGGELPSLNGIS